MMALPRSLARRLAAALAVSLALSVALSACAPIEPWVKPYERVTVSTTLVAVPC